MEEKKINGLSTHSNIVQISTQSSWLCIKYTYKSGWLGQVMWYGIQEKNKHNTFFLYRAVEKKNPWIVEKNNHSPLLFV